MGLRIAYARGEILGRRRLTTAKAFAKNVSINQERKLEVEGDQIPALVLYHKRCSQRSRAVFLKWTTHGQLPGNQSFGLRGSMVAS
ncbi:hypothetical protein JTE90_015236 [Oedothorax gibbosus]|uniref:Uncharacterized protein n=1 Tax=Oedothorax gibbosus TaxID=931172 RepID=A0AAV6TDM1_9ARAC|nr:hypothetical protein JTE90_015236 [Oedothorax gibbosus]